MSKPRKQMVGGTDLPYKVIWNGPGLACGICFCKDIDSANSYSEVKRGQGANVEVVSTRNFTSSFAVRGWLV